MSHHPGSGEIWVMGARAAVIGARVFFVVGFYPTANGGCRCLFFEMGKSPWMP